MYEWMPKDTTDMVEKGVGREKVVHRREEKNKTMKNERNTKHKTYLVIDCKNHHSTTDFFPH